MRRLILALALPLAAGELNLTPGEFVVAPGQRILVLIQGAGGEPGRLRDAALYTSKGVYNVVNLRPEGGAVAGDAVVPAAGTLILAVRTTPEVVSRERRSGFAKVLVLSGAADDQYRRAVGSVFEIIPQADPYRLGTSGRLPLRLLVRGEPAADAAVEVSHDGGAARVGGHTDAQGVVEIPITGPGRWRLRAVYRERCADAQAADWESYTATLAFAAP